MADFVKVSSLPGNVKVITFVGAGGHSLSQSTIAAINHALDEVENDQNAAALVFTNEGKNFSLGLDLVEIKKDQSQFEATIHDCHRILKRVLLFPIPSIAVICGHAVAAGCMFALAHDYRIMAEDRGYIFLNEVDIKLPLSPGMNSLVRCKIPGNTFYKAVLGGTRFTGKEAVQLGFVDASFPDSESTLEEGLKRAKALAARNFDRENYRALKTEMFKAQIADLNDGSFRAPVTIPLAKL